MFALVCEILWNIPHCFVKKIFFYLFQEALVHLGYSTVWLQLQSVSLSLLDPSNILRL